MEQLAHVGDSNQSSYPKLCIDCTVACDSIGTARGHGDSESQPRELSVMHDELRSDARYRLSDSSMCSGAVLHVLWNDAWCSVELAVYWR